MVQRLVHLLVLVVAVAWSGCAPSEPQVTEFALPSQASGSVHLVAAPDALWVVETFQGKLARISLTGAITEFPLPPQVSVGQLAAGPDGTLWFTEQGANKLGRLDPSGLMREVVLPPVNATVRALAPDYRGLTVSGGAVWVTESANRVVRRVSKSGAVTTFLVDELATPPNLLVTAGDVLWISSLSRAVVGRMTQAGTMTTFSLPLTQLGALAPGPAGGVWFADQYEPKFGVLTPEGLKQTFTFPSLQAGCRDLVAAPDGAVWCPQGHRLVRITQDGILSRRVLPPGVEADELVVGSDGALWFTDGTHNTIGRLPLAP